MIDTKALKFCGKPLAVYTSGVRMTVPLAAFGSIPWEDYALVITGYEPDRIQPCWTENRVCGDGFYFICGSCLKKNGLVW